VIVGDADPRTRAQIGDVLERIGYVVADAETGTQVVELARSARPAAVVVDVALPEISGYQVCNLLRNELGPVLPIFLMSRDRVETYDRSAGLLLGATDYLVKPVAADDLLARIGAQVGSRKNGRPGGAALLTPSEIRVLRLLASGLSTTAMCDELNIAPKTVSMHIQNAMKKLDVHTRAHAVALAFQLGLVESSGDGVNGRRRTPESLEDSLRPSTARPARARRR